MLRTINLLLSVFPLFFLLSCGSDSSTESKPKVIVGKNDLRKVDPRGYGLDRISGAVGVMLGGCTVSHIGNGIAVTAGHCIHDKDCRSDDYQVVWGYTSLRKGILKSQCIDILAHELSDERDFAILRYDSHPQSFLEVNLENRPHKGDPITIYSHPQGRTLENSGWCEILGEIEGTDQFAYECDTEGGSSGAAVLNRHHQIVGLHNFGNMWAGYNAGTFLMSTPLKRRGL